MSYNSKEEYEAQVKAFQEVYPDFKPAKDIEVLNLIMTRKNAKEILEGKKKVEYRAYSEHYVSRLYDKNVTSFIKKHEDEESVIEAQIDGIVDSLRIVRKIHFHDYNNTWYLDATVLVNDEVTVQKEDMDMLHQEWDSHDLDELYNTLETNKAKDRPVFFFFVIDKILDTNLK